MLVLAALRALAFIVTLRALASIAGTLLVPEFEFGTPRIMLAFMASTFLPEIVAGAGAGAGGRAAGAGAG